MTLVSFGCGAIQVPPDEDVSSSAGAPVFESVSPQTATEGVELALTVTAADPEGTTVTYTLVDSPDTAAVSSSGRLTWTPDAGVSTRTSDSVVTLTVRATDAGSPVAFSDIEVQVTVRNNSDDDDEPDATDKDDDNDGVDDAAELTAGSDPTLADTDDDAKDDGQDNCPIDANATQLDTDDDDAGDECDADDDDDGELDEVDNCRLIENPKVGADQPDLDGDGKGDSCDDDVDGDSVVEPGDNCPKEANPKVDGVQADTNEDGEGDACDPDDDGDGLLDAADNCARIPNKDQKDNDADELGDECDPDDDNDGELDATDNCQFVKQTTQKDTDGDTIGDLCDSCIDSDANIDADVDGVCDTTDNCLGLSDFDQTDTDSDGQGNACDTDDDDDQHTDITDNCPLAANPKQENCDTDLSGDACDDDDDDDLVLDLADNCVCAPNAGQADCDADLAGDSCDPDDDGDEVPDLVDNCPYCSDLFDAENPGQENNDQDVSGDVCDEDDDNDTIPDVADNCQLMKNVGQLNSDTDSNGDVCDPDDDNDSRLDESDNCRTTPNQGQENFDGDVEGDACDLDDDNDTALDDADTCLFVVNPLQTDVDADGIGDACDPVIPLSASIAPNFATLLGAVGPGAVALALGGPIPCTDTCLPASYYVYGPSDHATSQTNWLPTVDSLGVPLVADDGATYLSGITGGGTPVVTRVVEGVAEPALGSAILSGNLPRITHGPQGGALIYATEGAGVQKLYHARATAEPALLKSAQVFDPAILGAEGGSLGSPDQYIRYVAGGKPGVLVLAGDDGQSSEPLTTLQTEIKYLFSDVDTKTPWYCTRKGVNAPQLQLLKGSTVAKTVPMSAAKDCLGVVATQAADGRISVTTPTAAGAYAFGWLLPGGPGTLTLHPTSCAPEVFLVGPEIYVIADCGSDLIDVIQTQGGNDDPGKWVSANFYAYGRAHAGNETTGSFLVAWRRNKSQSSAVDARFHGADGTVTSPTLTEVDSAKLPSILCVAPVPGGCHKYLWLTRDNVIVSQIRGTFDGVDNRIQLTLTPADGTPVVFAHTFGYVEVFETQKFTFFAHNGTSGPKGPVTAGFYWLNGTEPVLLAPAGVSGSRQPVILDDGGDVVLVALSDSSGLWTVWRFDLNSGEHKPVLSDLLDKPTRVGLPLPGAAMFTFVAQSDALAPPTAGLLRIEFNTLEVLRAGMSELIAETAPGGGLWGYRYRGTSSDFWSVCSLMEPDENCTALPTGDFLTFTAVDSNELFSAVWVDTASGVPTLFRSIELED